MTKTKFAAPTAEKRMLELGLNEEDLKIIYTNPFNATREIKLSMFQFKINHNILATNVTLYKYKLSDTEMCPFCKVERHTIQHFFVNCDKAMSF